MSDAQPSAMTDSEFIGYVANLKPTDPIPAEYRTGIRDNVDLRPLVQLGIMSEPSPTDRTFDVLQRAIQAAKDHQAR